jgi:hypothetical protein
LAVGAISSLFDEFQLTEIAMTNENLTIRVAQALLAVTATAASVLIVQIAMLVG